MTDAAQPTVRFDLDAGAFVLSLAVADDASLHQVGLGPAGSTPGELPFPVLLYPSALPTFGDEIGREAALRLTHADGATSTRLVHRDHETVTLADAPELPAQRIGLTDRVAPTGVDLWYRPHPDHGLVESWLTITNRGDAPLTVHRAASVALAFAGATPTFTHWGGGWAGEWTETTEALAPGVKSVASFGGVRPSLHRPPVVLLAPDGPATETTGTVVAATLVWGGDARASAEVAPFGQQRLILGARDDGAERVLDPGDAYETPHALWTWSDRGVGETSRRLHRHVRDRSVRDGHRIRATVVNTWEAVGFSLDPDGLVAQARAGAEVGGELFLLDDGWFGTEFPRNDDTQGLGDWDTDRRKFPDGLQPMIDRVLATGLRFGLWVEPEMVNPRSTLYRDHPDWVIGEAGRERREERNQLVLDLTRPEVRDHCVAVIDRVLTEHRGISYLKWDANRDVTEPGSATLAADRRSHLPIDRVHATWAVMAEVARRHPDVELMLCASGGGRAELGTLRYFHELWTSDNTDPVDRVRIQWGASHLLPANVLGAHVTRWGNRPVAFGCAVAMSGRFGFDLDLLALDAGERATCRRAAADYAAIRDLVQQGDLHRLASPVGSDRAALAYTDPAGERAVVFAYFLPDAGPVGGRSSRAAPEPAGVALPDPPAGKVWQAVDRTPDRPESLGAGDPGEGAEPVDLDALGIRDGRLPWPNGPLEARIVELVAR